MYVKEISDFMFWNIGDAHIMHEYENNPFIYVFLKDNDGRTPELCSLLLFSISEKLVY